MKQLILPDDHDLCIRTFLTEISNLSGTNLKGVLHVGAHMGEEVPAYIEWGFDPIYLVEANPEILPALSSKFEGQGVHIIPVAVGEENGTVQFTVHRTAKGSMESAGILPLDRLGEIVPVFNSDDTYTVPMVTIDHLAQERRSIDLLTLDIQGAEMHALRGAKRFLSDVSFVICEVNLISNYKDCALERDIDEFMAAAGFTKRLAIYHELYDQNGRFPAWGECLWQR